ncbi:hypothetical protein FPCIR_949 [Fusarium pseudocircinatum]|uniref:Uncharacterized protein n=1 Tax=Fusarium pseudocircinatum TaxID=56676 RepID=A0A8H5PW27_9HYPO|nr:hypothetical protein FPCIR_949 [Fusarium pseudocircinatum]
MSDNPPRDKPITSWFRFELPENILLDESLFHALHPTMEEWACYGRIKESPQDCVLLVDWYRSRSWLEFSQSDSYAELLSSLGSHSDIPVKSEIIDFARIRHLGPSVAYGKKFQHRYPYKEGPCFGWVEGNVKWEGQDAVACVWVHKWKNQEAEEKFKTTARYPHMKDGEFIKPLILDLFEQGLRDLGAFGWEECYVNFETTCYIP